MDWDIMGIISLDNDKTWRLFWMVKVDTLVSFQEVPDEITLCINISNCPCHCEGLSLAWQDIGKIINLINKERKLLCLGGDTSLDV